MQFRVLSALIVFLGSYFPLSLILLAQDLDYSIILNNFCFDFWKQENVCPPPLAHPILSLLIFTIFLFCFLFTLMTLYVTNTKRSIIVTEAKYIPAELMSYTLPYVVAFMSIGYNDTNKFIGFLIFLGWMFWITYKSGQIILNPLLIAFGWKLYDVKYYKKGYQETLYSGWLLSKTNVTMGKTYFYNQIQDILIVKPKKDEG